MEVEEIQTHGHKYRRIGNGSGSENGRIDPSKRGDGQYPADEEEDGEVKRRSNGPGAGSGGGLVVAGGGSGGLDFRTGRLCGWPSSRIVRVSRASGGKDRHSKVWTSKGLRDRRVRLSVNTAIQFYDLQDRLGYDQPSKAVEWLLKAAASSISELPSINTSFPDTPKQVSDEKGFDSPKLDTEMDPNYSTQVALPKSACSSNSENSKGSGGLSLSRSESRIKARERARERARAVEKDKDKENESIVFHHDHQLNQNLNTTVSASQHAASFTELLTSGMNGNNNNTSPNGSIGEPNFFNKSTRNYSSPMDYFASSGQIHLGNPLQQALTTISSPMFSFTGDQHHHHHHQEQQFSFLPDHFVPVVTTTAGNNSNEYNLNFTISSSSGLAGYGRGTLQSNASTPSSVPHIQRFPTIDGSSQAFFIGSAAAQPNATVAPMDNHHQHQHQHILPGYDARLQLCYGDGGSRHSDQKGKGKS